MKIPFIFFLFFALSINVFAQNKSKSKTKAKPVIQVRGKAEFDKVIYDLGKIKEEDGVVTVSFKFSNKSKHPISLTSVEPGCGCTTPEWSKAPVYPNSSGIIKAAFDPKGRPGEFYKGITVKTDGDPSVIVLRLKGEVIPRPKSIADLHPYEIGNLRFKENFINFGAIPHDAADTASLSVYNQGKAPIYFKISDSKIPSYMSMSVDTTILMPQKTTFLRFSYNAQTKNDWGHQQEQIIIKTDDVLEPSKNIYFSAEIRENFGDLEGKKLPKVKFDKLAHNFGEITQSQVVSTTFKITNEGEAPLIIRKTKAACGCTASSPQKNVLKAGESTEINVSFNAAGREGEQKKSVSVICNDPYAPETTLWFEAKVSK